MKDFEWAAECRYITAATDSAMRGIVPAEFSGDLAIFIRYCEMQRNTATREGRDDSAQYIQHCIDDLEGNA